MKTFYSKFYILLFLISFLSCEEEITNKIDGNSGIKPASTIIINIPSSITVGGIAGNQNPSTNEVFIEWTAYNSPVTNGYQLTLNKIDTSCSCLKPVEVFNESKNTLNKKLQGLDSDATYVIQISAINSSGNIIDGSLSSQKSITTRKIGRSNRPNIPLLDGSILTSRNSATIKWQKSTDLSDTEGKNIIYNLLIKDSDGNIFQSYPSLTTLQKEVTGLSSDTTYSIEIIASGATIGDSDFISYEFQTKKDLVLNSFTPTPGENNNLATDNTANKIYLSWDLANALGNVTYEITAIDLNGITNRRTLNGAFNSYILDNLKPSKPEMTIPCISVPFILTCTATTIAIPQEISTYKVKIKFTDTTDGKFVESSEVIVDMNFQNYGNIP